MVLSPSRNNRSNFRADEEWLENLGEALKSKDSKDGLLADSVLQASDLPNRPQKNPPVSTKSGAAAAALHELTRCSSQECQPPGDKLVSEDHGQSILSGPDQDGNHKIPVLEDIHKTTSTLSPASESQPDSPDAAAAAAAARSDLSPDKVADDVGEACNVDKLDVVKAEEQQNNSDEDLSRKDSSGEWSDGVNRRKERVVPEETLRKSHDSDVTGEETDLAPLPFSGPISAVGYSGPMFSSGGSISRRSDGSSTSTRSFAFPVLPFEWNTSPARMPPPDRRWRRRRNWCKSCCLCCAQPSTHP